MELLDFQDKKWIVKAKLDGSLIADPSKLKENYGADMVIRNNRNIYFVLDQIIDAEFEEINEQEYDKNHLFDPTCINIGNEDELSERLTIKPVVVKTAFVFHYKAVTLKPDYEGDRNDLSRYHK